jgi:hypothetical protein
LSSYETQIGALRKAGDATKSASGQVAKIDLADAVADAGTAMPGGQAAGAFTTLGNAWRGDLAGWIAQAEGYADALTTAAERYAANEQAAAADFRVGTK